MADINSITLAGRLTRDAELKYSASGVAIMRFSIAVNARKKEGNDWIDEANFFDITMFGKLAEAINSYLTKGKQVAVTGMLRQDRWEAEGQSKTRIYIIADNVMMLGSKEGSGGSSSGQDAGYERSPTRNIAPAKPKARSVVSDDDFEDDIPF